MIGVMKAYALGLILLSLAFAADDPWTKVKELQSGTEVKILKAGVKDTLSGTFSEADDERLIVVIKNTQMAMDKRDVLKLEARPKAAKKVATQTTTKNLDPSAELAKPKPPTPGARPTPDTQSSSTSFSYGDKPGYEIIYRKGMK